MKISYQWLRQYIDLPETPAQVAALLTNTGLEVEGIEEVEAVRGGLRGLVVGQVLTCTPHPDADKLSLTTVDIGGGTVSSIVCGAPNVRAGQKVVVATVGATLYPTGGEPFTIKKAKIRGQASEGMLCAEDEIGLGAGHDGILVLNTDLPNGTPAAAYFDRESDHTFEIGLTPNRADAASHVGVARDLRAVLRRPLCLPSVAAFAVADRSLSIGVRVEDPAACPRYAGLTLSGLTVADSPAWLQQRLRAIGLSPINNVVDVTNFVLHELGQPLHAFDADRIAGGQIIVKTLPAGTPFVTLDGQTRQLTANDLMICDAHEPMCIAGVFGGARSGVTKDTTRIFLESAYFAPDSVRRTAQHHGLKTDASFRFERGTDPNLPGYALQRAALLMQQVAGGTVTSDVVDVYPQPIAPRAVTIRYDRVARLIGKALPTDRIQEILRDLDIEVVEETADGLRLLVPPYRVDVTREADVTEEILRIYGFDNVEMPPHAGTSYLASFPSPDVNRLQLDVAKLLAASGFSEIITNSLTRPAYADAIRAALPGADVEILNKLSEDLGVLRQTLLFSGLEAVAHNLNRRQKNLRLFEFGKQYHQREGQYTERKRLAVFITGNQSEETWREKNQPAEFHDLAGAVQKVLGQLNASQFTTVAEVPADVWQYGLTYQLRRQDVVRLGLVQPALTRLADVKQPVFYADLDWELLLAHFRDDLTYTEIPKFPEVRRDLSLVLDAGVAFEAIRQLAFRQEKTLLRAVNAFDVYTGENLGEGKKSYSVSFILQDDTQTLTDQAIDRTMQKLIAAFERELHAVIRK